MKTRWLGVVAVAVALFGIAWNAGHARAELAHETDAADRERLAADARLRDALRRRTTAVAESAAIEKRIAARHRPVVRLEPVRAAVRHIPTIDERLRTEPDAQLLWLKLQHARAAVLYGPLFRKLGLTPEQIAKFEENVAGRDEQQMDIRAIATENRMKGRTDSATTAKAFVQADQQYTAAQRSLLGDTGLQALQEYERTSWVRNWVNGWAGGAVVNLGEPLTAQQGEQLVQIIASASDSYRNGGAVGQIDWAAADAAAQRILTPTQYRFFATTEPPLPAGGRFQSQLYQKVEDASTAEVAPSTRK
ncbi:MAG TPA: hypothetical protein VHE61_03555 [Opitutaceae bacterium]|nr:hypothetical protein [Opitutaceae bacterium]